MSYQAWAHIIWTAVDVALSISVIMLVYQQEHMRKLNNSFKEWVGKSLDVVDERIQQNGKEICDNYEEIQELKRKKNESDTVCD